MNYGVTFPKSAGEGARATLACLRTGVSASPISSRLFLNREKACQYGEITRSGLSG